MSGGGFQFTPLSKTVLVALVALYVVQLVADSWLGLPVLSTFAWLPFGSGFHPWQPFTAFFLNGDPMRAFFNWLFLFFILPAVEPMFSMDRLRQFTLFTYLGSIVFGFAMLLIGAVTIRGGWFGIEPFLAGLLVLFGLSRPNATILLMFIIPIKAAWVAWGSGLLCLLNLLSGRDLGSVMWLAGWLCGYVWLKGGIMPALRKPFLRMKHQRLQKKLSRFDVIDGGKGWGTPDDDDLVH
jgi:membrane associated rhomboid family serine protease